MALRSLFLVITTGAWLLGGINSSRAGDLDRTTEGQNVTVSVTSPFNKLTPGGCVPFRVNIKNDQNSPGTWQLSFRGYANNSSLGTAEYKVDLSVGPNRSASFDVLAPMPIVSADKGNTILNIGVKGPGFGSNMDKAFFAYFYTNNSGSRSPYTIIESEVLGDVGLGPLSTYGKGIGNEFYGSSIDALNMPSDWRAYSGVAVLILKDTGWLSLNAAQREAVCDYVSQGGHLTIFTAEDPDQRAPELQLPGPDGKPGPYGFGSITLINTPTFPPASPVLQNVMEKDFAASAYNVDMRYSSWRLQKIIGTIALSSTFVLCFVVLFGSLVGPVNLFVFARGAKRFRLFWTTPLISISACLVLMVGILFTDGIGGTGRQVIAILSIPALNREAIIQEQVARTAVLFSSQWHNDQDYLINPISSHVLNDEQVNLYEGSPDVFRKTNKEYSGSWFRSRAISGQYLQAMRPSRSALTVLNPSAVDTSHEAPVVLSSFPQILKRVFLVDSTGQYWTCENLEPGHKQTCVASTEGSCNSFWTSSCADAGGKLGALLYKARDRRGFFYASGIPSADETLATLGEIRWQVVDGVYLGPWVASTTEESGK